ncbi:MAG: hypothetical protein ACKVPY_17805 [Paracoccaceae bacterium]
MAGASIQQMAERVAQLMEERLRVRGRSLDDKLRRGGRALPKRVLREAWYLAEAADRARVPKLLLQLDHARIAEAYDICVRYLKPLGAGARRWNAVLNFATSLAAIVLVTAVLVLTVLVWRGYL